MPLHDMLHVACCTCERLPNTACSHRAHWATQLQHASTVHTPYALHANLTRSSIRAAAMQQ